MKHLRILFIVIFVLFPLFELRAQDKLEVVRKGVTCIIGKALNARAGAVVVTDNDSLYYIKGMKNWNDKYYDKTISITGFLIIEQRTYEIRYHENGEERIVDHLPPIMQILLRPRKIRILE